MEAVYKEEDAVVIVPSSAFADDACTSKRKRSSSSNKADNDEVNRRRKYQYYIRIHPLPRILKRDIRREYVNMYINVQNSSDGELVNRYIDEFYVPNCQFEMDLPWVTQFNFPRLTLCHGRENLILNWKHHLTLFPDFTMQLYKPNNTQAPQQAHIIQREGLKGCIITFYAIMRGTIMHRGIFHALTPLTSTSSCSTQCNHENNCCIHCQQMKTSPMLTSPIKMVNFGWVTFHVDEEHRINRILIDVIAHELTTLSSNS